MMMFHSPESQEYTPRRTKCPSPVVQASALPVSTWNQQWIALAIFYSTSQLTFYEGIKTKK